MGQTDRYRPVAGLSRPAGAKPAGLFPAGFACTLFQQVAGGKMPGRTFAHLGFFGAAPFGRVRAAGVEPAARGHVACRRDLALENDGLALFTPRQHRDGRQKRLRIW